MSTMHSKIILTIVGIFVAFVFWSCSLGNQTAKESAIYRNFNHSGSVLGFKAPKPTWPDAEDSPRVFSTIFGNSYDLHIIKGNSFGKASDPVKIYIDPAFYTFLHNSAIVPFQQRSPEQIKQQFEALFCSSLSIEFVNSPQECDIDVCIQDLKNLKNAVALTILTKFWIVKILRDMPNYSSFKRSIEHLGQQLGIDLHNQGIIMFNNNPGDGLDQLYKNLVSEGNRGLSTSVFADYLLIGLCLNHEIGHYFGLAHPNQLNDTFSLEDVGITPAPKQDLTIPSVMMPAPNSALFKWIYDNYNLDMKAKMRMMNFNTNDKKYIFRNGS